MEMWQVGSFEAPIMWLLQCDSSLSTGAADTQIHRLNWTYVAPCILIFESALNTPTSGLQGFLLGADPPLVISTF